MAYCFCFAPNERLKNRKDEDKISRPLQIEEIEQSLQNFISVAQRKAYSKKIHQISQKKEVSRKSKIFSFRSFLDTNVFHVSKSIYKRLH